MANWLSDLITDTLGATGGVIIRDGLAGIVRKAKDHAEKKIDDLIKNNPRADLLYVLLSLDPADAEKLWQRHLNAIRSGIAGAENDFVRILGQALPRDAQGNIDMNRAKAVFSQIAQLDEARFCQIMEELNHDPIAQHVRYWLRHGKNLVEALINGAVDATGHIVNACEDLNNSADQLADRINRGTQNRQATRSGRFVSRIR